MGEENKGKKEQERAESLDAALKEALAKGLMEKMGDEGTRTRVMEPRRPRKPFFLERVGNLLGGIRRREIFAFCEELGLLLEYGVPMVKALKTMADRVENPALSRLAMEIGDSVEKGSSFSDAVAPHQRHFPPLVINMFRAGERSGNLTETLHRVASHGERLTAAKYRAVTALVYPALVIVLALIVISFVFSFAAQVFEPVLAAEGAKMPWMMTVLLTIGTWVKTPGFWVVLAVIIVALVILYQLGKRVSSLRLLRDRFLVRCPVVRRIARESMAASFARVVATMLQAGVPLQETLQSSHDTTDNELMRLTISRVQEAVSRGERITPELERAAIFPPVAYDLLSIGEEAGALGRVSERIADIYEEKVAADVAMISRLIQPAVVIILGLTVGFVVVALFSTYATMLQELRPGA